MAYDFALVHAPSVFDFRNRDDVLFGVDLDSDGALLIETGGKQRRVAAGEVFPVAPRG